MKRERVDWSDTLPVPDDTRARQQEPTQPTQRPQTRVLRSVLWLLLALVIFKLSKVAP